MKKIWLSLWIVLACISGVNAADLWVDAESFAHKGGWKVDQQFMDSKYIRKSSEKGY